MEKRVHFAFNEFERAQAEIDSLADEDLDAIGGLRPPDDEMRRRALELSVSIDCGPEKFVLSGQERVIAILALREYADPPVFTDVKPGELGTSNLLERVERLQLELHAVRSDAVMIYRRAGILGRISLALGFALVFLLIGVIGITRAKADECHRPGVVWSCTSGQHCDPVPVLFTCVRPDGSTYAVPGFAGRRRGDGTQ